MNVRGMAIGNGWIDPYNQYDISKFAHGVGLISYSQYLTLQRKNKECQNNLQREKYLSAACFDLLDDVIKQSSAPGSISIYDYRIYEKPGDRSFPPGHKVMESYMNLASVKKAFMLLQVR